MMTVKSFGHQCPQNLVLSAPGVEVALQGLKTFFLRKMMKAFIICFQCSQIGRKENCPLLIKMCMWKTSREQCCFSHFRLIGLGFVAVITWL